MRSHLHHSEANRSEGGDFPTRQKRRQGANSSYRQSFAAIILRVGCFWIGVVIVLFTLVGLTPVHHVSASDPGTGDWPMWGGTPDRNMVSNMKGLPASWDITTKKNVKWVASLGSQTYGNPVVAGGMVFAGTNNEGMRDPKQPGDRGVLMAFRESDGEF